MEGTDKDVIVRDATFADEGVTRSWTAGPGKIVSL